MSAVSESELSGYVLDRHPCHAHQIFSAFDTNIKQVFHRSYTELAAKHPYDLRTAQVDISTKIVKSADSFVVIVDIIPEKLCGSESDGLR